LLIWQMKPNYFSNPLDIHEKIQPKKNEFPHPPPQKNKYKNK
jgi:hypothetical protein